MWGSDVKVNQNSDSADQAGADMAMDHNGDAIVVWKDERASNYDIYAQKINSSDGGFAWTGTDKKVNGPTGSATDDQVAISVDPFGNTYAVWRLVIGDSDVFIQKLNSTGDTQYTPNEKRVTQLSEPPNYSQYYPDVATDPLGNAIVAWIDGRRPTNEDIFAQKIDEGMNGGAAYIFYGKSSWNSNYEATSADITIEGAASGDLFGSSVSGAGNVDNSGYNDIVVGAPGYLSNPGSAHIFYGDGMIPTSGLTADKIYTGEATNDRFGFSVSGAGDMNNDGMDDVIIGAPFNDENETDAGKAYIYLGNQTMYVTSNNTNTGTITNFDNAKSSSDSGAYATITEQYPSLTAETGDVHFLVAQGAPERGSESWWEWTVVNPTGTAKTCTEVRIKRTDNTDMSWTVGTPRYPTDVWTDGGAAGLYWTGSETIPAHSGLCFRIRAKNNCGDGGGEMTWSVTVTGETVDDVYTTAEVKQGGSLGGLFYNLPNNTVEQTEAVTYEDGLYCNVTKDKSGSKLLPGIEYQFFVNVHEWAGSALEAGGYLNITIPKEFNNVYLNDTSCFTDATVSYGGTTDWFISGTNDAAISNDVQNLSFNATTPLGYNTNKSWEFDTRFTGKGGASTPEMVRYVCEANILVQPDSNNYRMDVEFHNQNHLRGDEYYLELNYSTDGTETDFGVQVFNQTSGNWDDMSNQGDLTSTTFTLNNYTLSSHHCTDDFKIKVRYIGRTEATDGTQSALYIEYHRIIIFNTSMGLLGDNGGDNFGWSVANINDINSDGLYDDVIVGAPDYHDLAGNYTPAWGLTDKQIFEDLIIGDVNEMHGIAFDSEGNVIIVIDAHNGDFNDNIYAQKLDPAGNRLWGANGIIVNQNSDTEDQYAPDIAIDSSDNAIIAWNDYRNKISGDNYAQKLDADGNPLWGPSDKKVNRDNTNEIKYSPMIALDSSGNAIIIWTDERNGVANQDVYAQKLNSDGNPQWDASDVKVNQNSDTNRQYAGGVAVDSIGNAIIIWEDDRNGATNNSVYAQKLDSNGNPQWGSTDKLVNQNIDSANQGYPAIVVDSNDNSIVTWSDERHGATNKSIYTQKLDSSGVAQWGSNDKRVNQKIDNANQAYPDIALDPKDDVIIVWYDTRLGSSNVEVYAQKLNSTGEAQWEANDKKINQNTDSANQEWARVEVDSDGSFVVLWKDERDGASDDDYYSQKFEAPTNGSAQIFYGGDPMDNIADLILTGENHNDKFGYSVHFADDIDGDNDPDVIIGAPYFDNGSINDCGKIYVFCGGTDIDSSADFTRSGECAGDHFGWSVSNAGDLNNDGYNDTITGAPHYDTNASETPPLANDTGKAYINSMIIGESQGVPEIPEFHMIIAPIITIIFIFIVNKYKFKHKKKRK
jgi:hypothetical protein